MAKIILSAFADEYHRDIDVQLKALSELGISYIEPRFVGEKNISELNDEEAYELKEKLDKAGIKVYSIGSPLGKVSLAADFDAHLALSERVFKTAKILGAKCIRVFSFYLREGDKRDEKTLAEVTELGMTDHPKNISATKMRQEYTVRQMRIAVLFSMLWAAG